MTAAGAAVVELEQRQRDLLAWVERAVTWLDQPIMCADTELAEAVALLRDGRILIARMKA